MLSEEFKKSTSKTPRHDDAKADTKLFNKLIKQKVKPTALNGKGKK